MKRFLLFLIICALLMTTAAAASDNALPVEVTLDSIEDIILESSPDLKLLKNRLQSLEDDVEEIKWDLYDVEEQMNSVGLGEPNVTSLISQAASLRKQYDNAQYQLDLAKLSYNQQVSQLILAARQQLVNCLSLEGQVKTAEANAELQQKRLEDSEKKLAAGYMAQKQYDELSGHAAEAQDLLNALAGQLEVALMRLASSLGLPMDASLSISGTDLDANLVGSIDFTADTQVMLDMNVDIGAKEYELNHEENQAEKDYIAIDNARIALEQAKDKAAADFLEAYNSLCSANASLAASEKALEEKQEEFRVGTLLYEKGLKSKKQLEDTQLDIMNLEVRLSSARTSVYVQYLNYLSLKNGQ
jgi:outer membrane protein TolC